MANKYLVCVYPSQEDDPFKRELERLEQGQKAQKRASTSTLEVAGIGREVVFGYETAAHRPAIASEGGHSGGHASHPLQPRIDSTQ